MVSDTFTLLIDCDYFFFNNYLIYYYLFHILVNTLYMPQNTMSGIQSYFLFISGSVWLRLKLNLFMFFFFNSMEIKNTVEKKIKNNLRKSVRNVRFQCQHKKVNSYGL